VPHVASDRASITVNSNGCSIHIGLLSFVLLTPPNDLSWHYDAGSKEREESIPSFERTRISGIAAEARRSTQR
jgi:hypothetical protein